jgi:transcription elongation GreA/GreB family factor
MSNLLLSKTKYTKIKFIYFKFIVISTIAIANLFNSAIAQPIVSTATLTSYDIEARARNGNSGFEGILLTPNNSGTMGVTMDPLGSPVWVSGQIYNFTFTFTKSTGKAFWKIDFNNDGDYNDSQESVSSTSTSLINKSFTNINIYGDASSGVSVSLNNLKINGYSIPGTFFSNSSIPFNNTYTETSGLFNNITVKGCLTFVRNMGSLQESPRLWIRCGSVNIPPSLNITNPLGGTVFNLGTPINITTNASDADGTISMVEFYNGSTLLGTDNSSPYSFVWNGATAGANTITVKAIDNNGASTSASVNVVVNTLPSAVVITSPTAGSVVNLGSPITISANASDADGTITVVEYYNGTTLIGVDSISPYSFVWNGATAGSNTITVKAIDNNGASSSASVNFVVNTPPSAVVITAPAAGSAVNLGSPITISANASDADGTITVVEFYNGATLIGVDSTSPYSFVWNGATAGSNTITVKAIDNNGASSSASVNVVVNTPPNAVVITAPTAGAVVNLGSPITISANASDADGTITVVEFYNGSTLLGTDNSSPYSFVWNGAAAGANTITVKAIDNNGASTSASVNVVVNTPPSAVVITGPTAGAVVNLGSQITISANASDADGTITVVEFYNGATLIGVDSTSPYSFVWNGATAGSNTITVKAIDNNGASTSTSVNIVINVPPTTSISSPASGTVFTLNTPILINAVASDIDGSVATVEFYNGTTLLGTDNSSPYSFTWNGAPFGTYTLTVKSIDNDGAITTSSAVNVIVNAPPTCAITNPVNNSILNYPGTITINTNCSDPEGNISKVEYFQGATKIGEDLTAPYSFVYPNALLGNYTFTAKVIDNYGASAVSSPVNVTVKCVREDLNNDNVVNNLDFLLFISGFNKLCTVTPCAEDFNDDGVVDNIDFLSFLPKFNFTCN